MPIAPLLSGDRVNAGTSDASACPRISTSGELMKKSQALLTVGPPFFQTMPTIFEVAKSAGVSTATVSRVLSRPDMVAATTRRRVTQVVERLGYEPNSTARNLRTLRTGKLIVTVRDIGSPFFSVILQGIQDAARREGYSILLGDAPHDERKEHYTLMLKRKEADGLIFFGHRLPKEAAALVRESSERCAPIVNGCEFNPRLGVPSVHIDNEKAASDAMDHLYQLGHRRIGIITGSLVRPLSRDRLRGATSRAHAERAAQDFVIMHGDFTIESGVAAAERLLSRQQPPTAIFCFNDEMAIGVMDAAKRRGVRIPDDLSVIGFDDIRFARYTDPPLTTISQPLRAIGEGTVRLLLEILGGHHVKTPESVTLPHTLTIRSSTARPRSA
jgi:LacI family transcriptional regulator, repressor for deo operon, udp, cdd, tsx, nupC, and nupG